MDRSGKKRFIERKHGWMSRLDIDTDHCRLSVFRPTRFLCTTCRWEFRFVIKSWPINTHQLHARAHTYIHRHTRGNNNDRIHREDGEKHSLVVGVVG